MTTAVDTMRDTAFVVGGRTFHSRLMVGTGKYRDNEIMARAIEASGAEVVTVAVRRVDLDRSKETGILHHLDASRFLLLANTAGCFTADDAVRYARLAREAGFNEFVKLEVIGDQETLLPDVQGLLDAARTLVKDGFKVLAYSNEDLVTALARRRGLRRRDAAGVADRQRARAPEPVRHPDHQAAAQRSRRGRRRRRDRLGCVRDDGAGRGRNPHEHRAGGGARSRGHGPRDAAGGRGWAHRLPRGPHAEA